MATSSGNLWRNRGKSWEKPLEKGNFSGNYGTIIDKHGKMVVFYP
jgi:hypothetical protein